MGCGDFRGTSRPLIRKTAGRPTLRCTSDAPCWTPALRMSLSSTSARPLGRGFSGLADAGFLEDLLPEPLDHLGVGPEEDPRVLPPLADPLPVHRIPRPALLHDARPGAEVEDVPLPRDPLAVEDVELGLPEGGRK